MKTAFRKSFQRDLKTLKKSHEILARIRQKIQEVEAALIQIIGNLGVPHTIKHSRKAGYLRIIYIVVL